MNKTGIAAVVAAISAVSAITIQANSLQASGPAPTVALAPTPVPDTLPAPQSALQSRVQPPKASATLTPSRVPTKAAPSRKAATQAVPVAAKAKPKVSYIKGYKYCGASARQAQPCVDQGYLVLYYPTRVPVLGGHDYKGWYWIDDLPNGRTVKIQSGGLKGTYKVYGHASVPKKGGSFPSSGRNAAVALQTCEGSRIEFSFLKRV